MTVYKNFIGIDIGKSHFFVAVYQAKKGVAEYENSQVGYRAFIKDYKPLLAQGFCVLETTGGYEMGLLLNLCQAGLSVHRANTRKVKHFIYSYGNRAKTDRLDAKALALYGYERHERLALFEPTSEKALELYELVSRYQDLTQMLVAEKNRLQSPRTVVTKSSCKQMIDQLSQQIKVIKENIELLIEGDEELKAKTEVLKSIPGIGDTVANILLILLPELGQVNRRQIAALAGLAPRANDSGQFQGYRSTGYGRQGIKPILFLAAMAARNSNTRLKTFYEQLLNRGKKKMVALTALMRKLLVIANTRLKEWLTTGLLSRHQVSS